VAKSGIQFIVERGAGTLAGFPDEEYLNKGASTGSREEVFAKSDVLLFVRALGANPIEGRSDLALLRPGQGVIGFCEPLTAFAECEAMAQTGVSLFSMELMPRITRAQVMDALSSMATVAGYEAVLMAARTSPRMFPMLMTAAGTIAPAKVFIIGAGVAGLQAIATAKRLGAVVSAYDIRAAAKEQAESVGAKFVTLDLDSSGAEGSGGYAKTMEDSFYLRQRELMTAVLREQDAVITTAAVPGRKAPVLITAEMIRAMRPGAVVIDMAAERGGNCELTKPGETVVDHGVTILGPLNLPGDSPYHASQMYGKNITAFLSHLAPKGILTIDRADEIVSETLVTHGGKVVHPRVAALLAPAAA
jgi:NAD(P) transhydrogenase subunit alpha